MNETTIDETSISAKFMLGKFECTVVSDGPFTLGSPSKAFGENSADEVTRILAELSLPTDSVNLQQNMLIVNTGRRRILFDAGSGRSPDFGAKAFGQSTGHMLKSMAKAGISPDEIDVIAITHAHPDHCWGLTDPSGKAIYKNATVLISEAEFDHWMSPAALDPSRSAAARFIAQGAQANLSPYIDQIAFVDDGDDPIEGVTALLAAGHSPGHTLYQIESEGDKLLHWGDLVHHPVLLAKPDLGFVFDFDGAQAVRTRLKVLEKAASENTKIFSCHLDFPGIGHLSRTQGSYEWRSALF